MKVIIFKKISFSSQLFQQRSCLQWVYDFFLSVDDFFFFLLYQLFLLPSSIFPLWFSHFYLGLSWFLRPSLCSLSVFLITHYLSFCSSSEISVAISKAFLWDLPDSIIKWIHGGVFVKMDPFFFFFGGGVACPGTLIQFLKTNQDKNNQLIFLPVCKILLAVILHIDL